MNCISAVVFFAALAFSSASLVAPLAYAAIPTGAVIQGPSSRTTVVGPDGSSISSVAPGGTIVSDHGATIVAQAAPAAVISPAAHHVAYAAAPVAHVAYAAAPALAVPAVSHYSAAWAPHALAYGAVPALGGVAAEKTVVAGPSGTIAQTKAVNAPVTVW
ncbi:hypothetical protein WA026_017893 [Henosepilachna vigintioctopunctata]|uniref:Cuticle protein n=1 Tax=Henosepilachna vigintioctopunctata TaxID=420089 RepID=A0AAW1TX82_9CUCU